MSVGAPLSHDPYAVMLASLAVTLAYLGYIDQARSRLNEALSEARRLQHPFTFANVLTVANWMLSLTRSPELQRNAEELFALSTEYGFPSFFASATAYRGQSLTALGQAKEGLTLLTQGLVTARTAGAVAGTPMLLIGVAEAYAMLGQPVVGLKRLEEAAQIIEATEERVNEAELHRIRGDLLNATGLARAVGRKVRHVVLDTLSSPGSYIRAHASAHSCFFGIGNHTSRYNITPSRAA